MHDSRGMRWLVAIACVLAACSSVTSEPGDDDSSPMKAAVCGEARDCRPDDVDCETIPYADLSPHCFDVCHQFCCRYADGKWQLDTYECQPSGIDAGVGAR
jgi:hypothetical protein